MLSVSDSMIASVIHTLINVGVRYTMYARELVVCVHFCYAVRSNN